VPIVTMQDVANYAGVSKTTVSRVMNNDPTVAPELRVRVSKAVHDLGYQPNRAARRLRASSSDVIGLIISDLQNPFFIAVMEGVEDMAYENQMSILLCNTGEDLERQQMYLNVMQAERVAGLILVPSPLTDPAMLNSLSQSGLPMVVLDRWIDGLDTDMVQVDNARGASSAVKHLIELGHQRIGMIVGSPTLSTGRERLRGYLDALNEAGIKREDDLIKTGNSRKEDGYDLARALMLSDAPPTAIFVGNSLMTLGALQALRELDLQIPQTVALVGFDDMPWSAELCPPLTTVAQPTYEYGREAVHLLLRRLAEPKAITRTVTLQTRLIIRESCGATLNHR
jgi:DNA-binding LacI/PurR family transcriptional regulator